MLRRGVLTLVLMLLSAAVSLLPDRIKRVICVKPHWEPISEVRAELSGEEVGGVLGGYVGEAASSPAILVVDTSGSTKHYQYQSALSRVYTDLAQSYRVGLVTYADSARLLVRPGGTIPDLDSLPARGGSNLVAGITEALDWFARAGTGGKIVLVSDGSMNVGEVDPSVLIRLAADARRMGVRIDVLAVGSPEGSVLEDFSHATYGTYAMLGY